MTSCREYQEQLTSLAVLGEPVGAEFAPLRAHLAACPACRAELARLRQVEAALRTWPLAELPRDLVPSVIERLAQEPQLPSWQLLPWRLWLPALLVALALGLWLANHLVGQVLPVSAPPPTAVLYEPLSTEGRELFWALWFGLFFTLAGVGVSVGLMSEGEGFDRFASGLRDRWEHLRESARL